MRGWYQWVRLLLALVFLPGVVVRNWDELTSGEALPTVVAVAVITFFAWLFLRPMPLFSIEGVGVDELRARSRREMAWWGLWAGLAASIVTWASAANGFRAPSLIVVAVPAFSFAFSLLLYLKAEAAVAKAAQAAELRRKAGR